MTGKNKKRKRQNASSDSSGTGNATFLISGDSEDLNMSAAMSDANVQKILNKIAQSKSETVRELTTLLSKAEGEMKDELERVTGTLLELQIENTRLRQTVEKYKEQQDDMMSEINSLKGIVKAQDKRLHDYEQYGRRNSLRIYGLPEDARNEPAHQTGMNVRKFCRDKLGVSLAETDIDIAHRLGSRQQDRHRSVIVKFVRRDVKQQVLKQRRKLKQTGIMVTDDLTPRHQQLLRDMKEVAGIRNCWSAEGTVFVKIGTTVKKVDIHTTQAEIRDLMNGALSSSLDTSSRGPGLVMSSTPFQRLTPRGFGRGRGRGSPVDQVSRKPPGAAERRGVIPSRHTLPLVPHVTIENDIEPLSPS
ncbi:hypothetical protein BaRGS_00018500 [Batillaria attramentaria]|uniref:Uncharacterized protein n=2 Tax=Batillaria attramentaria TaxID=370345 RepID=A0ABD0KSY5_9CAEN